jgi:hypothetical protein
MIYRRLMGFITVMAMTSKRIKSNIIKRKKVHGAKFEEKRHRFPRIPSQESHTGCI